jgi:hypothetical protein
VPDAKEDNKAPPSVRAGVPLNELDCHQKVVRHGIDTLILPGEVNSLFGIIANTQFSMTNRQFNHEPCGAFGSVTGYWTSGIEIQRHKF